MSNQRAGTTAPYLTLEKSDMKKTLVALAALAATGAFAQSTVTLYGKIDASVGAKELTSTGAAAALAEDKGLAVSSGVMSGSRWGMKGTEDLGGGLNAVFQLENGFNIDAGSAGQGGLLFGRQAYVGLTGGFGSLTFGRQYTIKSGTTWALSGGYANYNAWSSQTDNAGLGNRNSVSTDAIRKNNSILYSTPNMSGLTASLMLAPQEDGTAAASGTMYTSVGVSYAAGPMGLHVNYETENKAAGTLSELGLAGSYNIAGVTLGLAYQNGKQGTSNETGWAFALGAPVGPASVALEYATETTNVSSVFASKASAWDVRVSYPLSKRTNVYGRYANGKSNTAGNTIEQALTQYAVGVRHDF